MFVITETPETNILLFVYSYFVLNYSFVIVKRYKNEVTCIRKLMKTLFV